MPTSIHLLGEQPLHDRKLAVSYLRFSIEALLLCNPLGHLPQAFEQKQGRFHCVGINEGRACVVCQAGSDCRVIAIRQTNDEVRIWASPEADKLHALAMQWMVGMSHRDPFPRWVVKGGSVL
ncbi:hypothetical protein KSZ_04060 [Dictyobacter formicarum]|uniref:Uncharacterized protein n=1 Tax=Dictyobacter formicarum TaxID=2778368 RepID=A0ABQ3V8E8_9CHLR|nr:hypothetical protein KSZ_04060 [Dictyobacter formicarum]